MSARDFAHLFYLLGSPFLICSASECIFHFHFPPMGHHNLWPAGNWKCINANDIAPMLQSLSQRVTTQVRNASRHAAIKFRFCASFIITGHKIYCKCCAARYLIVATVNVLFAPCNCNCSVAVNFAFVTASH